MKKSTNFNLKEDPENEGANFSLIIRMFARRLCHNIFANQNQTITVTESNFNQWT